MKLEALRKIAGGEEIDYLFLISALKGYAHPRDKISAWLKSGELIRVKKGLYVFGHAIAQTPYSLEILANLIYGPSAISLSYALAFYGLIPERVDTITNITSKRRKKFSTLVGNFIYYYLPSHKYSTGIKLYSLSENRQFLIATPEKALCDQIILIDKKIKLSGINDIESYLFHDLRIDASDLKKFNCKTLSEINQAYHNKKINLLIQFLKKWIS